MDRVRRALGLVALVAGQIAAAWLLHRLGALPWLRVGWDDPGAWLAVVSAEDAVMAALRLVALAATYWLLASTVAYTLTRATRLPAAVRAVEWATLPVVRRAADRAVAVTLVGSVAVVGAQGLALAEVLAPPAVSAPSALPGDPPAPPSGTAPAPPSGAAPPLEAAPEPESGPESSPEPEPVPESVPAADADAAPGSGPAPAPVPGPAPGSSSPVDPAGPAPGSASAPVPGPAPGSSSPVDPAGPAPAPDAASAAPPPEAGVATHEVVPGDNLWAIAAALLGEGATDAQIHGPWRALVEANRDRLHSGDPDLIYPGEHVVLPGDDRGLAR